MEDNFICGVEGTINQSRREMRHFSNDGIYWNSTADVRFEGIGSFQVDAGQR